MRFRYTEVGTLVASREASMEDSYFRASEKNCSCFTWEARTDATVFLKLPKP